MAVGILLIPLCRSQAINSLVFVAQGRNLNIVAEACSNDLNVFSRIILAAFSRKQINASRRFTHLQHHARHRAINYGGVFYFLCFSLGEKDGQPKDAAWAEKLTGMVRPYRTAPLCWRDYAAETIAR